MDEVVDVKIVEEAQDVKKDDHSTVARTDGAFSLVD